MNVIWSDLEDRSRNIRHGTRYGTFRVSISQLRFGSSKTAFNRENDVDKIRRLKIIYTKEGVDRLDSQHTIRGVIGSGDWQYARTSQVMSNGPACLTLPSNLFICCEDGKSRVAAFVELYSPSIDELWWTVDISEKMGPMVAAHPYKNEGRFSDGHAVYQYCQLRDFEPITASQWKARLTTSKFRILKRILGYDRIKGPLMRLLQLPGMRRGLLLGVWPDMLSRRMDEEIGCALETTYRCWLNIMGDERNFEFVDDEAVECIQLRAPAYCASDRDHIAKAMNENRIFRSIADVEQRQAILHRLEAVTIIIPSIYSVQQDSKYIGICMKTFQELLLGDKCKTGNTIRRRSPVRESTIRTNARKSYCLTESNFLSQYKLLILYIMRHIEQLSPGACLTGQSARERKSGHSLIKWRDLGVEAQRLGFNSTNVNRLVSLNPDIEDTRDLLKQSRPIETFNYTEGLDHVAEQIGGILQEIQPCSSGSAPRALLASNDPGVLILDLRCGRQLIDIYTNNHLNYTASCISSNFEPALNITSLFVWKCQFQLFFGNDGFSDGSHEALPLSPTANTQQLDDVMYDADQAIPSVEHQLISSLSFINYDVLATQSQQQPIAESATVAFAQHDFQAVTEYPLIEYQNNGQSIENSGNGLGIDMDDVVLTDQGLVLPSTDTNVPPVHPIIHPIKIELNIKAETRYVYSTLDNIVADVSGLLNSFETNVYLFNSDNRAISPNQCRTIPPNGRCVITDNEWGSEL